jgi:uncharacterized membrane protein YuzA (DUF378 family)
MMTKNRILKTLTTRLFVALIVLSVVGWIILFGKNLPSRFTPVVYAIIALSAVVAIYFYWKKPYLLRNKKFVAGLVVFIVIGAVGWLTSISEITECRPYKSGDNYVCAKPYELGMRIVTGDCTSEFPETIDFYCSEEIGTCVKKSRIP